MIRSLRLRLGLIYVGLAVLPMIVVGAIIAGRSYATVAQQSVDLLREVADIGTLLEESLRVSYRLFGLEVEPAVREGVLGNVDDAQNACVSRLHRSAPAVIGMVAAWEREAFDPGPQ